MSVIEHAEKFLGRFSQGWKEELSSDRLQVVCFRDSPFETVDAYLTVGLSHHELKISNDKKVRQELIFPVSTEVLSESVVSLLLFICELALKDRGALLRGQVMRLPPDAAKKLGFDAIYCAIPVFLDDEFATIRESRPPTVIVWVVPIYNSEADYVDAYGWNKFEDLLEEESPDLFSLGRKSVV